MHIDEAFAIRKKKSKYSWTRAIFVLIALVFLFYSGFLYYKFYVLEGKINPISAASPFSIIQTIQHIAVDNTNNLHHTDPERINILLLGVAGQGKPGSYLTDTIVIASLNLKTNQVAFLSIPRDLLVKVPNSDTQTKINAIYQIGFNNTKDRFLAANALKETITDITSLPIDYFAMLNFDGFRKIIDSIGGVNVMNERDLYDARYPGENYSYETFQLAKGFQHLDGATALKYARERHNDPEGDFGRAKRQQQIMQAVKNKIFSLSTLANPIAVNNLLTDVGDNLITDATPADIADFFRLSQKMDTQNITNKVVDAWNKESLLIVGHVMMGEVQAFVLLPRVGNWSEIQDLAQNIFDLDIITRRQEAITKEDARIAIINRSGNPQIISNLQDLFQKNLDYKNVYTISDNRKGLADTSTVYDLTNGTKPFTTNELITKLPAKISYDSFDTTKISTKAKPDVIIVIGKDLIDKYTMAKGTLDDLNNSRDDQENPSLNNQ